MIRARSDLFQVCKEVSKMVVTALEDGRYCMLSICDMSEKLTGSDVAAEERHADAAIE